MELSSSGPGPGQVQVRSRSGPGQEAQKLTWALQYFWFSPPPTTERHNEKLLIHETNREFISDTESWENFA